MNVRKWLDTAEGQQWLNERHRPIGFTTFGSNAFWMQIKLQNPFESDSRWEKVDIFRVRDWMYQMEKSGRWIFL